MKPEWRPFFNLFTSSADWELVVWGEMASATCIIPRTVLKRNLVSLSSSSDGNLFFCKKSLPIMTECKGWSSEPRRRPARGKSWGRDHLSLFPICSSSISKRRIHHGRFFVQIGWVGGGLIDWAVWCSCVSACSCWTHRNSSDDGFVRPYNRVQIGFGPWKWKFFFQIVWSMSTKCWCNGLSLHITPMRPPKKLVINSPRDVVIIKWRMII